MQSCAAAAIAVSIVSAVGGAGRAQAPALTHGPLPGHADGTSVHVFARAAAPGSFVLHVLDPVDGSERTATATADPAHDLTLHFVVDGLVPHAAHEHWITSGDEVVCPRAAPLRTAIADEALAATIAFGSCAHDVRFPEQPIWQQIVSRAPDALLLLGDTPYIDDGTVEGRRRRHREFLAFEPLVAALRAIPTWTTWDDHDYATNDAFGATTGSATARPVFVDYHAHASYGDGARGIYTRFRRGPIDVFVLDTRSFADVEQSLLAPGERSLLGRAQTEWLQQGLAASTAPFRVLACGMVWNGGVRPKKRDCWGNWLAERDALFRWLGEQRIGGVVLVGGDVHRSRVILHPTAAQVGYELPELITSPLAQDVLDSNDVPVPGLVFDAGEPSSCLLLGARIGGADGAVLTAAFVAGDGRTFHERSFPLSALSPPDAAQRYRELHRELIRQFGESCERLPDALQEFALPPNAAELACRDDVRAAVALAAPVFAIWERAALETRCAFWPGSEEPALGELLHVHLTALMSLEGLAHAKGVQCAADGDLGELGRVVRLQLATARHLRQEPTGIAWHLAATFEQHGARLVGLLPVDATDARRPIVAVVERHLAARAGPAAAAAALKAETLRLLEFTLATLVPVDDAEGRVLRRSEPRVRGRVLAALAPLFAAGASLADPPTDAQRDALARCHAELVALCKVDRKALRARLDADAGSGDAADALATLLLGMLAPSLPELLEVHERGAAALRAAVR